MTDDILDKRVPIFHRNTALRHGSTPYLISSVTDPLLQLENEMELQEAKSSNLAKIACAEYAKPNHGNLSAEIIAWLESKEGWDWTDGCKEYLAIRRMDLSFGMWINRQMLEYASTNHGRLSTWHIQKLQKFRGWKWSGNFDTDDMEPLASWIEKQRREYAKPNHGHLSKVEVRKLESFPGWTWSGPLGWREEATCTRK